MARNKETLLFLIDVGPQMHSLLPEVEKLCSMVVQKKLIYHKQDEIGIVLFGTEGTHNELTEEVGGYENISVLQNIKVVDGDVVDALKQIPRGTVGGDFIDAIVVGMDMLIKKYGTTNKGKKRLCLITNALSPTKDPDGGTKEDQVGTIAFQMTAHGMKLDCIVVRGRLGDDANDGIKDENDRLLNLFPKKTHAKTVYVESPTSFLGALQTRNIAPFTVFRGHLEVNPNLKIKVWVYKKTAEERFPTLKRYSDKAPPTDKFATHEVKVDLEYKSIEDPSKVVPPDQRIKGYRYGPQVVPVSPAVLDAIKFRPEKGVKLLGFTDASYIPRHYYLKDVYIFIPEPGNAKAKLAVSAIARAMKEMDKVAILRCVWRQNQGNVVVGVLTPNISDDDKMPDSFYFNVLPFADDVREFEFPSFSNLPASWMPDSIQQEAADNLVNMFNLAPFGREEALRPDFTPNPILERFYRHLELKSKDPDAAVPPLDETLKKITEPDRELLSRNKHVLDEFKSCFELRENPKLKKTTRKLLQEKPSGSGEEKSSIGVSDAQAVEMELENKVQKIGDSNPIQDFEAMMSRRDSPEWVGKAITDMKNLITNLVKKPFDGDNYSKALECLLALRKGCILEQEPKQFNDFLHELCQYCQENHQLSDFRKLLVSKGVMLITKREASDSEVTDDEAKSFLVKTEMKVEY